MAELVARVNAAARRGVRAPEPARGEPIEIEELRIDPREVQAYVDGESCRADADRVPAPLPARARPGPRRHARRAPAEALGPARVAPRPDRRRLRPPAAREDRPPRARGTRSSRPATASATSSSPWPSDKASQGQQRDAGDDEHRSRQTREADPLVEEDGGEHRGDHDARLPHRRHRRRRRAAQREQHEQVGRRRTGRRRAPSTARRPRGRARARRTADRRAPTRA